MLLYLFWLDCLAFLFFISAYWQLILWIHIPDYNILNIMINQQGITARDPWTSRRWEFMDNPSRKVPRGQRQIICDRLVSNMHERSCDLLSSVSPWSLHFRHSDILELNHYSIRLQDHVPKKFFHQNVFKKGQSLFLKDLSFDSVFTLPTILCH